MVRFDVTSLLFRTASWSSKTNAAFRDFEYDVKAANEISNKAVEVFISEIGRTVGVLFEN